MTFVYCLITEIFCFSFHFHSQILWSPHSFVKTSKHPSKWGKRERALKERQQDSASNWKGDRIVWSWLWLHICNICLWGGAIKYDLLWQMSLASVRKVRARAGGRRMEDVLVSSMQVPWPASRAPASEPQQDIVTVATLAGGWIEAGPGICYQTARIPLWWSDVP